MAATRAAQRRRRRARPPTRLRGQRRPVGRADQPHAARDRRLRGAGPHAQRFQSGDGSRSGSTLRTRARASEGQRGTAQAAWCVCSRLQRPARARAKRVESAVRRGSARHAQGCGVASIDILDACGILLAGPARRCADRRRVLPDGSELKRQRAARGAGRTDAGGGRVRGAYGDCHASGHNAGRDSAARGGGERCVPHGGDAGRPGPCCVGLLDEAMRALDVGSG